MFWRGFRFGQDRFPSNKKFKNRDFQDTGQSHKFNIIFERTIFVQFSELFLIWCQCLSSQERDGELLSESDEFTYECGVRQKYPILFDEPIPLQAGRWYVAWARVSGPSSDCGSSGQSQVNKLSRFYM
jgi:hypothetical protein